MSPKRAVAACPLPVTRHLPGAEVVRTPATRHLPWSKIRRVANPAPEVQWCNYYSRIRTLPLPTPNFWSSQKVQDPEKTVQRVSHIHKLHRRTDDQVAGLFFSIGRPRNKHLKVTRKCTKSLYPLSESTPSSYLGTYRYLLASSGSRVVLGIPRVGIPTTWKYYLFPSILICPSTIAS